MNRPYFTVSIPTKNCVDRLRDAVRSMIEQTDGDFDVVCSGESHQFASGERLEYLAVPGIELQ